MQLKHVGRILAALGGLLLVSSVLTWMIGAESFVKLKLVTAMAFFAFFFATNWRHIGTTSAGRSSFFVGASAVSALAVIALLCLANYLAVKRPMSWDFTSNQIHQLSADTQATLRSLQQDVKATAFVRADEEAHALFEALFEKYAAISPRFGFEFVDPLKDPLRATQMNIRQDGPRVVLTSEDRESRVSLPTEEALTNALLSVTRIERKKVGFSVGRREARLGDTREHGLSNVAKRMSGEGLEPVEIALGKDDIAQDIEIVVIAGPQTAFDSDAVDTLRRFLLRGGRLFALVEPMAETGLDGLLSEFDLAVERARILDAESRLQGGSEAMPLIHDYNPNEEITRGFQVATVFPTAAPVKLLVDDPHPGVAMTQLAFTSRTARLGALPTVSTPATDSAPAPEVAAASNDADAAAPEAVQTAVSPQTDSTDAAATANAAADAPLPTPPADVADSAASDTAVSDAADSAADDQTADDRQDAAASASDAAPQPADTPAPVPAKATPSAEDLARRQGPFPIAARASAFLPPLTEGGEDRELRIVLVGDRDFATNGYSSVLGNEDFFLNSLNWLASQAERITIRPKLRTASRLYMTPERQAMMTFFVIDLLPITILAFGLTLWMLRRSK